MLAMTTQELWTPGPATAALNIQAEKRLAAGSQEWIAFTELSSFPRFFADSSGPYLFDPDGRRYIDLYCGSGSVILGHGDPRQAEAVAGQAASGPSLSFRPVLEVELATRLHELIPGIERVMFFKTGSEACHGAINLAVQTTGRDTLLSIGYHGWIAPYAEILGRLESIRIEQCGWDLDEIERTVAKQRDSIAGIMVAPDPNIMNIDLYKGIEELARSVNAAFIMDEVKSGFRAAFPCVTTAYGLRPDIMIFSKAFANGYPLAVVGARSGLLDDPDTFPVFSTFAVEAISLRAAQAGLASLADGGYDRFERASRRLFSALSGTFAGASTKVVGTPTFFRLVVPDRDRAKLLARLLANAGVLWHPFDNVMVSAAHDGGDVIDIIDEAMRVSAAHLGLI
jgi:glutamate-1-semialdehyde aminotransferase